MSIEICHLTSVHPIDDIRIFWKECISLSKCGFDTTLIACGEKEFISTKNGVKLISLHIPAKNRIRRMIQCTIAVYKKAVEINADIYHLHDPELMLHGVLLKLKGKKVVFDSHEDVPAMLLTKAWIPKLVRKFTSYIYALIEKIIFKKFDALISVTPSLTERLLKLNSNTFQVSNFPILDDKILKTSPQMGNSATFAGGIVPQWSHKEIINSLDKIENISYNLAGNIEEKYFVELTNLPGWEKVNYVGKLPFTDVASFISQSSVGMALCDYSPNVGWKKGSLGNTKLFEYMMAGLPVICTDFELWKEIIEKNNCGICVNPHNEAEITDALSVIFSNKEEAKKMGENGRKMVKKHYNWSTQEEILIKLYKKLI